MNRIATLLLQAVFALVLLLPFPTATAQSFKTNQVIVASGGQFGNPNNYVRIGAYNPNTKVYTVFDSIRAASTKTVITDGKFTYLTADTLLVKYDIDNHTRMAVTPKSTTGLSYLATYKNYVIATRGYGAGSDFVKVYNNTDLTEAFTITGISDQAAGIVVVGDTAYVAVAGPYNKDTGTIAVIDLVNMQLKREIMLDTLGAQIGRIFTDGTNVYAVNSKRNVITTYNVATCALTHKIGYNSYPSGFGVGLDDNKVFMDFGYSGIGYYDIEGDAFSQQLLVNYNKIPGISTFSNFISGAAIDTLNNLFYVSATNYASTGETYIFNTMGEMIDTFAVGVSPEAIAVDYRSTVGIQKSSSKGNLLVNAYPNPAKNTLYIGAENLTNAIITVTDISGKVVMQQNVENNPITQINIQHLPAGLYIINVKADQANGVQKFIKQ